MKLWWLKVWRHQFDSILCQPCTINQYWWHRIADIILIAFCGNQASEVAMSILNYSHFTQKFVVSYFFKTLGIKNESKWSFTDKRYEDISLIAFCDINSTNTKLLLFISEYIYRQSLSDISLMSFCGNHASEIAISILNYFHFTQKRVNKVQLTTNQNCGQCRADISLIAFCDNWL